MTQALNSLLEIASDFDAMILDQWGVLHDGTQAYPGAVAAVTALRESGVRLAVLSNSGKRAALNAQRIAAKGFAPALWDSVMTSGEALWQQVADGGFAGQRVFAITAHPEDACRWAQGLSVAFVDHLEEAEVVLIMGLAEGDAAPDEATLAAWQATILSRNLPVYCSNPDKSSPRAGGRLVMSPGALAHRIADAGGRVAYYGKPHLPVYRAIETALQLAPNRCLMVGDSLEHDIAGAHAAGWATAFIRGGIHAAEFDTVDMHQALAAAATRKASPLPDFTLATLR